MNHAISYSDFSRTSHVEIAKKLDVVFYEHIVAAVGDINFALPRVRALSIDICQIETGQHSVSVFYQSILIQSYTISHFPGFFGRLWHQVTTGFVSEIEVECIKCEIAKNYTYGDRIIL